MFRDRQSGEMRGMDADLARALGHDLGVPVVFVDINWRNIPEQLDRDRCDVAMGSIGVTAELAPRVRFTKPYLKSDHFVVVSAFSGVKSWADLDQPSVAVGVRTNSIMETIARRRLRKARIVIITDPYTPDGELEAGRIDAYLANFSMARYAMAHTHGVRVLAPDKPFEMTAYAYAARPGDDDWVARLDAFVEAIKRDGRLEETAKRWGYDDLIVKG
jgi:ABC-type amino acid transport substrate-binding protein